jgi:hypothetical protein
MKTIIIFFILMSAISYADSGLIEVYEPNEIFDLGIHVHNSTSSVTGADCNIQIRNETFGIILDDQMNEIGGGWYNYTYNTSRTGKYFCRQNCTSGGIYSAETCDFIIEGETMSPEAIQISLLAISFIIAIVLFIMALHFKDVNLGFGSGFLFTIIGIYVFKNGFADLSISNFVVQGISIIIIGLGIYILFRTSIETLEEAENG